MPYVKHVCLHANVNKSLDYILNPDKTEDLLYTTSLNCTTNAHDAYLQMKAVYEQYAKDKFDTSPPKTGNGTVKAIQYIQSFDPKSNITPELAHKITKAFVRKTFGDDVQAVIATHVDKEHVHSHIIINSYSLSGQKFYANKGSLKRVREYSDGVCRAFGIEPSPNFKGTGRTVYYNEWEHRKNGTSWKQQIREEIDKLIPEVKSLDELLQILEERGYEIKRGKYISVKAPGQQRAVRSKTLGEEYTEESLNIRIIYREVGAGETPVKDGESKLWDAYASIIGDVRILAEQSRKVPRKQNMILPYSADNDLDVFRLSAQLAVISKEKIISVGDLEGRIRKQKADYERERDELNQILDEHNRLASLLEQADTYYRLAKKESLTEAEKLQKTICRKAMEANGILYRADHDQLRNKVESLSKKISARKENLVYRHNDIYTNQIL